MRFISLVAVFMAIVGSAKAQETDVKVGFYTYNISGLNRKSLSVGTQVWGVPYKTPCVGKDKKFPGADMDCLKAYRKCKITEVVRMRDDQDHLVYGYRVEMYVPYTPGPDGQPRGLSVSWIVPFDDLYEGYNLPSTQEEYSRYLLTFKQ